MQGLQRLPGSSTASPSGRQTVSPGSLGQQRRTSSRCNSQRQQLGASGSGVMEQKELQSSRRAALVALGLVAFVGKARADDDVVAAPSFDAERIKSIIREDFVKNQYYYTGRLTEELYRPTCLFEDPITQMHGVQHFKAAATSVFDPAHSKAELVRIWNKDANTIAAHWRMQGMLQVNHIRIAPYEGTTTFHLDDQGKVVRHVEEWDPRAMDSFQESFDLLVSLKFASEFERDAPPVYSAEPRTV